MKYSFEICYQTDYMIKAQQLLDKLDLGDGIFCLKYTCKMTRKDDELSIFKIKENIIAAFEYAGCKVLHIEGGKVE